MEEYYKPPKANLISDNRSPISPDTKLFKVSGVGIATFFGSLLAGGVIIGLNYLKMNEQLKARNTFIISFLVFMVFMTIVWFLPEDIPNMVYTIVQLVIMMQIAKQLQEGTINLHMENDGRLASNWAAFGISLLVLILIVAIVFLVVFVLEEYFPEVVI